MNFVCLFSFCFVLSPKLHRKYAPPRPAPAISTATTTLSTPPIHPTPQVASTSGMPAAVETSKRKFHQLLDNLTKASAPSSTKDSPLAGPKRVRLEPHRRITTPASRLVTSLDTASATPATASGAPEEPNYTPWSHGAFLTRLKTFADVSRWTSKPDAVNEVAWAKRGWVCAGLNTVSCRGGCEKRVVIALRPPRKDSSGAVIEGSEDYSVEIGRHCCCGEVRGGTG